MIHSDVYNYTCTYCPKKFKTAVQLAGHTNTHKKRFSCELCNRPFSSLYDCRNHLKTHSNLDSLKFTCDLCGAQYARSFALQDHIKAEHPNQPETAEEDYIVEETEEDMMEEEEEGEVAFSADK